MIVGVNLRQIKELARQHPFLQTTALEAFEESIRRVERETSAIAAGSTNAPASASTVSEPVDPFLSATLAEQCAMLGLPLETVELHRKDRQWLYNNSSTKKPEPAVLAYFQHQGFVGTPCEGAAPLMIMKSASLDYLAKVNTFNSRADACSRYFEAQCWLNAHLAHYIIEEIRASTEAKVRTNFREIASQSNYAVLYPPMDEDALIAIWRAITPEGLARLAEGFFRDPYKYRAGWPDLTLARGNEVRFVEVKTTDRLHASQKNVIGEILIPFGASVSVVQVRPLKS